MIPNGASVPLSWLVEKIEDRVGNNETFTYQSFGYGEVLLSSVAYTGLNASVGNRTVNFSYKNRGQAANGATDIASSALAGGMSMQTQALNWIMTAVDGVAVRRYEPSYQVAKYSGRLLMTSLTECTSVSAPCQRTASHPATQFVYNDGDPNFELKSLQGLGLPSTLPDGEGNEDYRVRMAGDYDGDGTRETVVSARVGSATQVYLAQFTPDRSAHVTTELTAPYSQMASDHISDADMDGSGRSALIGLPLDASNVAFGLWNYALFPRGTPATSNPFGTVTTNIPLPAYLGQIAHGQTKLILPADVDGDGKTDIVTIYPTSQCNNGQQDAFGYLDGVFLNRNISQAQFEIGQTANFASPSKLFCLRRTVSGGIYSEAGIDHIGDVNGDGLADFYLTYEGGIAGIAITQAGAASASIQSCSQIGLLDNGTATDDCSGDQNYATRWMDVNADGLEDFVIARPTEGTWRLRLNRGNGTFGPEIDTNRSDGLVKDLTGSSSGPAFRFRYANRLPAMDVDSDGKVDLLIPSQKRGAQAFALKMCTIKRVPKITGADVPQCPTAIGSNILQSVESVEAGEVCAAYSCPPNPDGSQPLPANGADIKIRENNGYPYQWNSLPAFDAYSSHVNHNGPGEDNSIYHLAQLKFIQNAPSSFDVVVVETPMVSRLSDHFGVADDLFGDGLPDLITSIGCPAVVLSQAGSQSSAPWSFQKCSVVNNPAYGPSNLPNGAPTAIFANQVVLFANINQGLAAAGGSGGAVALLASQRPTAPTLITTGSGVNLSLPVPNLPGLMDSAINGVGDFATWGYFPLSVRAARDNVPFYTVRSDGQPSGYTDKRHYYFQSSMPVVYGMSQNVGDGSVKGARSAFYGYTEAMYHHLGRGFQGFRSIVSNNVAPSGQSWRQLRTTTTFHQKFPLTGRIEKVETKIPGTGRVIKLETDNWICDANRGACLQGDALGPVAFNANGGTVYAPLLDSQRVDSYDLGTGAAVSHTTTVNAANTTGGASGWDDNGNLINQIVTSADDGAGGSFVAAHTVATTNYYLAPDLGNWWLDRLSTSSVSTSMSYATGHTLPGGGTVPIRTMDTSYFWNSPNRTPQSQTVSGSGMSLTTRYDYGQTTAVGLPKSVTIEGTGIVDGAGLPAPRTTQFTYTKDGTSVASQQAQDGYFVLTTTNAALQSSKTEHSPRDGQVTLQEDPNHLTSTSSYDGFGRLTGMSFKDASNLTLLPDVTVGYSPCSGGTSSSCGSGYGEGDNQSYAAWRVTRVQAGSPTAVDWFDVLGRPIKHVERGFSGDFVETTTDYDAMGTTSLQSTPFYQGQVPYLTAWSYDALGRPTQKNSPGSELDAANGDIVTTYAYNGTKTTIKVRGANVPSTCSSSTNLCMDMSRSYDVLGRLEQTVQGNGGSSNYAATNYWYDGVGNPIAAQDAGGSVLSAIYNDLGQRTDLSDPDAGHWQFTYNALGEVIDQTDARGVVTNHVYDVLGRLRERTATNTASADTSLKVIRDTWAYDPPGATGGAGLLDYSSRQKGATKLPLVQIWKESNAYESNTKRVSNQSTTLDGQPTPWVTSYTYDSFGRPFTTGYPSGLMVRKDYTSYGDLRELSNYGTSEIYWTGSAKDAWGNLTDETYLGSIVGTHSSHASTGQSRQKNWTKGGVLLNQLNYSYDSFGNIKSQTTALDGVNASESYLYDGLQRLTNASRSGVSGNPAATSYAYLPNGNLSAKSDYSLSSPGSYSYGANGCGPHGASRVGRSGGPQTYLCDANGNVISGSGSNTLTATYDFNNQPWTVSRAGAGTAQFAYSANGDVFRTLTGSANTWFGAAGYEESQTLGTTTQRHELGPVVVLREGGVETTKAVLRDRLGSQVMLISANGGGQTGLVAPTLSATPSPSLDGNYTVSWTSVSGATQFKLYEAAGGNPETLIYTGGAVSWSQTARPMGSYTYRVMACNTVCSPYSAPLTENVAPPAPSTIVASPNPSFTGDYTVSWSPVSGVQSYTLEERPPGLLQWNAVSIGSAAVSWSASGRATGSYAYRVRACLAVCGNPSGTASEVVANSTLPPPASISANPNPSSTGNYTITWAAVTGASGYKIEELVSGAWVPASLSATTRNYYSRPAGSYPYRARACDANGNCGTPSAIVTEAVTSVVAPFAPVGLMAAPAFNADGNYLVSWSASPGAGITYRLEESSTTPVSWHEVGNQTALNTPFSNRGEGVYSYRVRACNSLCSPYGATVYVSVRLSPEPPVLNTPVASSGYFTLTWNAPPTTTSYVLEERLNGGVWRTLLDNGNAIHTNSLTMARGNGTYEYRVAACSLHCSMPSNIVIEVVSGSLLPTIPGSISSSLNGCVNANQTTFTISWGSGGVATSYQLHEVNSSLAIDRVLTPSPAYATSMQLTRNRNAPGQPTTDSSTYEYEVRACAVVSGQTTCTEYMGKAYACIGTLQRPDISTVPSTTAYDAFGKVRNGDYSDRAGGLLNLLPDTLRGFTGHQHVDDVRLIHMNGRVYDYELGRFLSVDPVIQFPTNTQSMNPYSYIMNNPLSGRDPSGYQAESDKVSQQGCMSETGSHICGVSGGAKNGTSEFYGSVRSTDPSTGKKTTTSFTKSVSNGVVSYTQTSGARLSAGTKSVGQSDGSSSRDSSNIDDVEKDPGQQQSRRTADTANQIADGMYNVANAFVPQDATDVAIMAGLGPLVRLGGKAIRLAGRAADPLEISLDGIVDAARLRMASREAELAGVGAKGEGFRSFTQGNFQENLRRLTGGIPNETQAHHVFPQAVEFSRQFKDLGINVHDPRFGAWWNGRAHNAASSEYNQAWRGFFRDDSRTAGEAFDFARAQASRYGYGVNF